MVLSARLERLLETMRTFADIQLEHGLIKLVTSANGTLHCVPVGPLSARLIVRHFDRDLSPAMVPVYADLHGAARTWVAADRELSAVLDVEPLGELGVDFIARRHILATTLDAFLETDPEEDPPEPPPELAAMQSRFRQLATAADGPRAALLVSVLARNVLERTSKTFFDFSVDRFVIADLKPTADELARWSQLS